MLVHPLGADRGVWRAGLAVLLAHHDCIAVDMPGFGESPELPADGPPLAGEIAAEIGATLDDLGVAARTWPASRSARWVALEFAKTDRCLSVSGPVRRRLLAAPARARARRWRAGRPAGSCRSPRRCCAPPAGAAWR